MNTPLNLCTVCHVTDIPEGEARMFVLEDRMIAIFNLAGTFYAMRNECPHAGASLAHGIVEGETVRCRIHHWCFSIRDGTYLDGDARKYNAETFAVHVVGDEVKIAIDD